MAALMCSAWILACAGSPLHEGSAPSDYERDLSEAQTGLLRATSRVERLAWRDRVASLTGDVEDLEAFERALTDAIEHWGPARILIERRARFQLHVHRPSEARRDWEWLHRHARPGQTPDRGIGVDLVAAEGHVDDALASCEELVRTRGRWEDFARLADLLAMKGERSAADLAYAQAGELIGAKEMRTYAWLELQRGLLDWRAADLDLALEHYRRADAAYSGHWLTQEHIGEALAALGRDEEARFHYRRSLRGTRKPQVLRAYADLIESVDPRQATTLRVEAELRARRTRELYAGLLHPS